MTVLQNTPAALAGTKAQERVNACIDDGRNFRLEAGAGAGKTYSLVQALKHLIAKRGREMARAGQQVACITFTEVARGEIAQEIEKHPAIVVETIHSFSWSFMAQFQKALRELVTSLEDRQETILDAGGVRGQTVDYNLGFFGVDANRITLSHDDIPHFMAQLLGKPKFRQLLKQRFPVIFIDEYQDTNSLFMAAVAEHFYKRCEGPLIGLFGDHWQTIYRGDSSLAEFPNVEGIDKESNFRSAPAIVDVLNRLRPELPQQVSDPALPGEVRFYHANSYDGERTNTAHFKGDVPEDIARQLMRTLTNRLTSDGWDFDAGETRVLMLTHNALAAEQGYPSIAKVFDRNEAFAKKEDALIALADTLEPMVKAFADGRYGEMFRILGGAPPIRSHADKTSWRAEMGELTRVRNNGTIGDVVDHLKRSRKPRLPDSVSKCEAELEEVGSEPVDGEAKSVTRRRLLRKISYSEVIGLVRFLDGSAPFATHHSVKGAEFENVLVILGGGWNQYNWPKFFELLETKALTQKNEKGFHRARNLFYVAISRPKRRLAVLATQTLSPDALSSINRLFGTDNIHDLFADTAT